MIHFKLFCFVPPPKKKTILVATVKAQKHVRLDQGFFFFFFLNNQLAQKHSNTDNTDWCLYLQHHVLVDL